MSGDRLTVPALVRRWARGAAGRAAFVVTADDALTYGELERRSAALACRLRRPRASARARASAC